MKRIEELLLELESKCRMKFTAPANTNGIGKLMELSNCISKDLVELYKNSDGLEVNEPGTVIYSISEVIEDHNNHSFLENGYVIIGHFNFGDLLAISQDGKLVQLDHETTDVFLEWDCIQDFLNDELSALD